MPDASHPTVLSGESPEAETLRLATEPERLRQSSIRAAAITPVTPAPTPGTAIGRYRILHPVGEGGMGSVFAAHDPELDRDVAIKLLHDSVDEARLVHEAKALARLAHPNVITVYDVGRADGRVFVAMELIDGLTLHKWLVEPGRTWREALPLFVDAGRGLAAAHAAGLVHRDFKPMNVLVGKDGRVRVLDFGIAGDTRATTAEHGVILGTPAYMAPEQFLAQPTDGRTDQFSFCVSLWEAILGSRPFVADSWSKLGMTVCKGELPDVSARTDIPGWLVRVLARGLSVHPIQRYPSMGALLADLEAGIAREQASAGIVDGRYELLRRSAEDSREAMQRALDHLTGELVTLAWIAREDDGPGIRPAREFERLHALRHPNLASVLEFGVDERAQPFLVLGVREKFQGIVEHARTLSFAQQVELLAQVLRALEYLHRHGLVHGGLGPSSVIVVAQRAVMLPIGASPRESEDHRADLQAFAVLARQLVEPSGPVVELLDSVLAGAPEAPSSALGMLDALAAASGRKLIADTAESRESFLRAAPLSGRERELATLSQAIDETIAGTGSAWLVGGESGVGKSRIVDRLRTLSRVRGALVLHGQEESGAGSLYRLWREPLRLLTVAASISDPEAGALLPIVPDVATLIGRPVAPAPQLDAPSMHARLAETVVAMLRRVGRPVVLLLEDLHWARADSLALLRSVVGHTTSAKLGPRDHAVMLVATYRNDERPELPDELAEARRLELPRLDTSAIAALARSMIGPAGASAALVEFLERESEGNAFFLVEVVRALADDAGSLERVGTVDLPAQIFAGGVRRVVLERLRALPRPARPPLLTAAVLGRRLDREVLAALHPDADLDHWIEICTGAAVLERHTDGVRFAHDKLREGALADVPEAELAALHGRVAEELERKHGEEPSRFAALAHHFGKAGDRTREARYATLAADHAVSNGAQAEGVTLLQRALALREEAGAGALERASLHRKIGQARFYEGRFDAATVHFEASLALLGQRLPTRRGGWALLLLVQVFTYIVLRAFSRKPKQNPEEHVERSRAAVHLSLTRVFRLDDLPVLGLGLIGANEAERAGRPDPRALGMFAFAMALAGLRKTAQGTFERARARATVEQDTEAFADTLVMEGAFLIALGELQAARARAREALATAERDGHRLAASSADAVFGRCDGLTGQLIGMRDHFARAVAAMSGYGREHQLGHIACLAGAESALGHHEEAWKLLEECRPGGANETFEPGINALQIAAQRATVASRRGQVDVAIRWADEAASMIKSPSSVPTPCLELLEGPAEAYATAWQRALDEGRDPSRFAAAAKRILVTFRAWARLFPIGAPAALLFEGRVRLLEGDVAAARTAFEKAVARGHALSTVVHEAQAWIELSRLSAEGSSERAYALARARSLLATTGGEHLVKPS